MSVFNNTRKSKEIDDEDIYIDSICKKYEDVITSAILKKSKHISTIPTTIEKHEEYAVHDANNIIKTIASLVPDEVIYDYSDYTRRDYNAALMFVDISGFTDLCETYSKTGKDGTSRMTNVLNSYIGSMVQEILSHDGDLLNYSGDAFLAMWKSKPSLSMQDAVHAAIDCALVIQRDYGELQTDVGIKLRVKVAISGGHTVFFLIGDSENSHYVVIGQAVWDVKKAEFLSRAGDVIASPSAWQYVNPVQYVTKLMHDSTHTKVLGIGPTWKHVDSMMKYVDRTVESTVGGTSYNIMERKDDNDKYTLDTFYTLNVNNLQNYADRNFQHLRHSVDYAVVKNLQKPLERFMLLPVMKAIENFEALEYLTEMRNVVIVFVNIVTQLISIPILHHLIKLAYKDVCRIVTESNGLVNKVSLFDKDMMFLIVFGLRGFKHELETQCALRCAVRLKDELKTQHKQIESASIGVTSGLAYCGVVGHRLRREYTVLGLCVNKGARLMVAYPDLVTCDKETFLQSKLNSQHFRLMQYKPLKGITVVGPVYEFSEKEGNKDIILYPLVNRYDEIKQYQDWINNIVNNDRNVMKMSSSLILLGESMIGKTRLLEEMITMLPESMRSCKISLNNELKDMAYNFLRELLKNGLDSLLVQGETYEEKLMSLIYDYDPGLSKSIKCLCDMLKNNDNSVLKNISMDIPVLKKISSQIFSVTWIVAVDEGNYIDDISWLSLSALLQTKNLHFIITFNTSFLPTSTSALKVLEDPNNVTIQVDKLNRWNLSTLVCHMLDVQAISPEIEKAIQSQSQGNPGWIKCFLRILQESKSLTIKSMYPAEIRQIGAITPINLNLGWLDENSKPETSSTLIYDKSKLFNIFQSTLAEPTNDSLMKVAEVPSNSFVENIGGAQTMEVIFLKTYDSLTPFEKVFLKCSSVLGEIFSRNMLMAIMQCNSRQAAKAVVRIFDIGFLECAGGDFTGEETSVLIRPLPDIPTVDKSSSRCRCIGITVDDKESDLPKYAWCGYIRFCNMMFYTCTYNLLTEKQKHEFHGRAIMYLEKNTKTCVACGQGQFKKLLGKKASKDLKQFLYIPTNNYPRILHRKMRFSIVTENPPPLLESENTSIPHDSADEVTPTLRLNFKNCECEMILNAMYKQIIQHSHQSDQYHKLIEAHLEYAELNIFIGNTPKALLLLFKLREFVKSHKFILAQNNKYFIKWQINFIMGRIMSVRGHALYNYKEMDESEKCFLKALELFGYPFPTSLNKIKIKTLFEEIKLKLENFISKSHTLSHVESVQNTYLNQIAETLGHLAKLYLKSERGDIAKLAAIWSYNLAIRSNNSFTLMCKVYKNMIRVADLFYKNDICALMIKYALKMCSNVNYNLDFIEMESVSRLYAEIIFFTIRKYDENILSLGDIMMQIIKHSSPNKETDRHIYILFRIIQVICGKLYITQAINMMHELEILDTHYNKAYYYFIILHVHLDTGYMVEPYKYCSKFSLEQGEQLHSTNEHTWNFFICMWLRAIRTTAWETAAKWDEKARSYARTLQIVETNCNSVLRISEGLMISLVMEINEKNPSYKSTLELIRNLLKKFAHVYKKVDPNPRYYLMKAYFYHIMNNDDQAKQYLDKSEAMASEINHRVLKHIIIHTRKAWLNELTELEKNMWTDHCENEITINYHESPQTQRIYPFTLPSPKIRF